LADALVAAEAGADALGFVFWDGSPRRVKVQEVADVIGRLPASVVKVGVFVDAAREAVFHAARICGLNLLQFHGEEPPEYCVQFGLMSMKSFRVRDASVLEKLEQYQTDAWLLDAYTDGKLGGTGKRFDWDLAIEAGQRGRPIFLAGGLTPENVGDAVQCVRPYGVDVSSGVEISPGKKDPSKVRAFIQAAKAAR
jgi:phosphoribosylanthranilate isomerase